MSRDIQKSLQNVGKQMKEIKTAIIEGGGFITCPNCGGRLKAVGDTRGIFIYSEQGVWRRRLCMSCKHKSTTIEVSAAHLVRMMHSAALVELITEGVNDAHSITSTDFE